MKRTKDINKNRWSSLAFARGRMSASQVDERLECRVLHHLGPEPREKVDVADRDHTKVSKPVAVAAARACD